MFKGKQKDPIWVRQAKQKQELRELLKSPASERSCTPSLQDTEALEPLMLGETPDSAVKGDTAKGAVVITNFENFDKSHITLIPADAGAPDYFIELKPDDAADFLFKYEILNKDAVRYYPPLKGTAVLFDKYLKLVSFLLPGGVSRPSNNVFVTLGLDLKNALKAAGKLHQEERTKAAANAAAVAAVAAAAATDASTDASTAQKKAQEALEELKKEIEEAEARARQLAAERRKKLDDHVLETQEPQRSGTPPPPAPRGSGRGRSSGRGRGSGRSSVSTGPYLGDGSQLRVAWPTGI